MYIDEGKIATDVCRSPLKKKYRIRASSSEGARMHVVGSIVGEGGERLVLNMPGIRGVGTGGAIYFCKPYTVQKSGDCWNPLFLSFFHNTTSTMVEINMQDSPGHTRPVRISEPPLRLFRFSAATHTRIEERLPLFVQLDQDSCRDHLIRAWTNGNPSMRFKRRWRS
jgi:hypothetical protein